MIEYRAELRVADTRAPGEANSSGVRKLPVEIRGPSVFHVVRYLEHNLGQWSPAARALLRDVHIHAVGDPPPPPGADGSPERESPGEPSKVEESHE